MPRVVGGVMCQRAERKGILIEIVCILNHGLDKITGAHVMEQITEKSASEWVVTEVLNDATAVGVGAGLGQFFLRGCRETFFQQRLNHRLPKRVNIGLVCEDRISTGGQLCQ